MTLCSPVCRRAVQRQITSHGEPIWISDDALRRSYQRFLNVSKTAKRYGSFVPGPLESRRRLGKRQMAYAQASPPTSLGGIGALWGWFRQSDNMQYEWQAPTLRPPAEEPPDLVQDWLSGLSPMPAKDISKPKRAETGLSSHELLDIPGSIEAAKSIPVHFVAAPESLNRKLVFFRRFLWAAGRTKNMENAIKSCEDFTLHLKQSFVSGETQTTDLHIILSSAVMNNICRAIPDSKASSSCCLALYEAIWVGVSSCKVLDGYNSRRKTTRSILRRLTNLIEIPEARTLSSTILQSLTHAQQADLRAPIRNLVFAWMKTWLKQEPSPLAEESSFVNITSMIENVDRKLLSLQDLIIAASTNNLKSEIENLTTALQSAKDKMVLAIHAINRLDNKSRDPMESVTNLAQALANITNRPGYARRRQSQMRPNGVLRGVIESCSEHISALETVSQKLKLSRLLMNLVALLPRAHEDLFYQRWCDIITYRKEMQLENFGQEDRKAMPPFAQWILQRWISCKDISDPAFVSNEYALMATSERAKGYSTILSAVLKCGGDITNCYNQLLTFLVAIGRPNLVIGVISDLQARQVRLLPQPFSRSLDIVTQHHPERTDQCLKMYKVWLSLKPEKRHLGRPTGLRLEYCPNFVLSLIENTAIPPKLIWNLLDIPLYTSLDSAMCRNNRALEPGMITLMEKMALSFSTAETRPSRVALRNVEQCLNHLYSNKSKIPVGISQAITHAGLTRKLLENDGIVGLARLRWCIDRIGSIEGVDVAQSVDEQVYWYRKASVERRGERRKVRKALPVDILDRRVGYVDEEF